MARTVTPVDIRVDGSCPIPHFGEEVVRRALGAIDDCYSDDAALADAEATIETVLSDCSPNGSGKSYGEYGLRLDHFRVIVGRM